MKKPETLLSVFLILITVVLYIFSPPIVDDYIEGILTDFRFRLRSTLLPVRSSGDIVIVAIDEESLKRYGRWPWSRLLQARLIEKILQAEPRVLGIDILYVEPESESTDRVLNSILSRYSDRVVLALGFEVMPGRRYTDNPPEFLLHSTVTHIANYSEIKAPEAYRCLCPPAEIASGKLFGHVYSMPDRDGKRRWEYLYLKFNEEIVPSFSLQLSTKALGVSHEDLKVIGGKGVQIGPRFIPTDPYGRILINYYGPQGSYPYIPAYRVLEDRIQKQQLKDRIVLLGVTALTLYDLVVTPFSSNTPGTEKNATVVDNILKGDFIRDVPGFINLIFILSVGITGLLIRPVSAIKSLSGFIILLSIVVSVNFLLFSLYNLRLNLFYPLLLVLFEGSITIGVRYIREEKKQRQIKAIFSCYVSPRIVKLLLESPESVRLGGLRQEVTVLFADIKGFTSLAEDLPPEDVVRLLNEYFREMTEIVFNNEGTLDKFMGDEIMAFWGAPVPQPEHPEMAVRCAIQMKKALSSLKQRWALKGVPAVDAGVGINTGTVVVGNIGAEGKKMDYTVIGDSVNLASRLQHLTRQYGVDILLSEHTYNRLSEEFIKTQILPFAEIMEVKGVRVRGRQTPLKVFGITIKTIP